MTLDPGYFRDYYASSNDPWGLAERWYERRKYALSLALLPREHYGSAFEPGCSIGVLTAQLAPRCGQLLACDAVPEAVASAQERTAGMPGVRVEQRVIPGQWPPASFDLVVFSELLYYFGDADLKQMAREVKEALGDSGATISSLGMFGNPLETQPLDRETADGFERLIDHADLFGADIVCGFAGRLRGKSIPDSIPRFKEIFHRFHLGVELVLVVGIVWFLWTHWKNRIRTEEA